MEIKQEEGYKPVDFVKCVETHLDELREFETFVDGFKAQLKGLGAQLRSPKTQLKGFERTKAFADYFRAQLDRLETRMEEFDTSVDGFKAQLKGAKVQESLLEQLDTFVDGLGPNFDCFEMRMEEIDTRLGDFESFAGGLDALLKGVGTQLKKQLECFETHLFGALVNDLFAYVDGFREILESFDTWLFGTLVDISLTDEERAEITGEQPKGGATVDKDGLGQVGDVARCLKDLLAIGSRVKNIEDIEELRDIDARLKDLLARTKDLLARTKDVEEADGKQSKDA